REDLRFRLHLARRARAGVLRGVAEHSERVGHPPLLTIAVRLAGLRLVVVEPERLALGRDDPQTLRPLLQERAEELAGGGVREAVGVEGDRDEGFGNEFDDRGVVEGARTEPGGVPSAALQRRAVAVAAAGQPDEQRPLLLARLSERRGGLVVPGNFAPGEV